MKKVLKIDNKVLMHNGKVVIADSQAPQPPAPDPWVRHADWLPLPELLEGMQMFAGLHAVFDHDSNFVALRFAAAYTVDWGDGVIENYNSNVVAYHKFNYSDFAGTECSRGYRQAIITVIPQNAQLLTSVDLSIKHNQPGLQKYTTGWLDVAIAGSNIVSINIRDSATFQNYLEQFQFVGSNKISNFTNFLYNCTSLHSVPLFDTSAGTNFSYFLRNCSSLHSVPLFDTSAGTNFSYFLYNCTSLQSVPLFDTSAGTNFTYFLYYCVSLQSVPLFDTSAGTNFTYFLYNCTSLQSVPLFDTSAGTNFSNFLRNCVSLQSVPLFDTSAGTNFSYFLYNCTSLQSVPLFDTSAGTNFSNFLGNCYSLSRIVAGKFYETISFANLCLSASAIEEVFVNLPVISGKSITISGNWGAALLTPAQRQIAIDKGWTIVG